MCHSTPARGPHNVLVFFPTLSPLEPSPSLLGPDASLFQALTWKGICEQERPTATFGTTEGCRRIHQRTSCAYQKCHPGVVRFVLSNQRTQRVKCVEICAHTAQILGLACLIFIYHKNRRHLSIFDVRSPVRHWGTFSRGQAHSFVGKLETFSHMSLQKNSTLKSTFSQCQYREDLLISFLGINPL